MEAIEAGLSRDPRRLLGAAPMHWRQVAAIVVCVLLNALDGFDVLSISFASPGIASEWGIDRAALGYVLSLEIVGMTVGSVLLGNLADRIGRRTTTLLCLSAMALGMLATTQVHALGELVVTRLFTGLGIGGMLATTNALTAEHANDRWRSTAVALMAAGYPLGVVLGGPIATSLLAHGGWRQVFALGAAMSFALFPLVPWLLPEPISALLHRRGPGCLEAINMQLRRLGHAALEELPPVAEDAPAARLSALFAKGLASITILLTLADFLHITTFYFLLKWIPKIVHDLGFHPAAAGQVLVWTNLGGLLGAVTFAVLSLRLDLRRILPLAMLTAAVMVALFGQAGRDLGNLSWAAGVADFFANAVIVGLYALIAASFPTALRAGGTGFVIGIGRAGAMFGPILAGYLFKAGLPLGAVAAIMGCGSLLAAAALWAMPRRAAETV